MTKVAQIFEDEKLEALAEQSKYYASIIAENNAIIAEKDASIAEKVAENKQLRELLRRHNIPIDGVPKVPLPDDTL